MMEFLLFCDKQTLSLFPKFDKLIWLEFQYFSYGRRLIVIIYILVKKIKNFFSIPKDLHFRWQRIIPYCVTYSTTFHFLMISYFHFQNSLQIYLILSLYILKCRTYIIYILQLHIKYIYLVSSLIFNFHNILFGASCLASSFP